MRKSSRMGQLDVFSRVTEQKNQDGKLEPRIVTLLSYSDTVDLLNEFVRQADWNGESVTEEVKKAMEVIARAPVKTMASLSIKPERLIQHQGEVKEYKDKRGNVYHGTNGLISFFKRG